MSTDIPPFAALIIHELEDYDAWKPKFDAHTTARRAAGILGHHLNRGADNPNLIAAYLPHTDIDGLKSFLSHDDVRAAMRDAGVKGTPDIKLMTVRSVDLDMSQARAGMIVIHSVDDYDKWRVVYDAFDAKRKELGVTGHAVNTLYGDANQVIVYHQAKTVETLKALLSNDELKERMLEGGVNDTPIVTFWNAELGAMY